jgi:hypothetical protein
MLAWRIPNQPFAKHWPLALMTQFALTWNPTDSFLVATQIAEQAKGYDLDFDGP